MKSYFKQFFLIILSLQYRNLIIFFCYLEKYTKLEFLVEKSKQLCTGFMHFLTSGKG